MDKDNIRKAKLTVLLVDDEDRFREATSRQFEVRGFRVIQAVNGQEAINIVSRENPDVVVLDQKMPGMDGIETFTEIKKINPFIEVIILTGQATVETALEVMKLGAFDYIMKPMNIDELLYKVEDAYTKRFLEEEKIKKNGKEF